MPLFQSADLLPVFLLLVLESLLQRLSFLFLSLGEPRNLGACYFNAFLELVFLLPEPCQPVIVATMSVYIFVLIQSQ